MTEQSRTAQQQTATQAGSLRLEDVFGQLDPVDLRVIFAALYAAKDIHAPLDSMDTIFHDRLDELAAAINDLMEGWKQRSGREHL